MEIVFTVLILLLTVALSSVIARLVPFHIPLPLMQIAIGASLAWPTLGLHIAFDPEVFMLLFIPPLLFADGWRIPKRDFFRQHFAIVMMALGLVLFTVFGIGLFVHWLIPGVPLAAAFALAAVLSPTDAVALSGIIGRDRIPHSLMNLLEGEALMNDASGLVALKFAVAAVLTGAFSLQTAAVSFFIIAIGGLAVGVAISWIAARTGLWLSRYSGEDPATQIVLLLLLPFIAYIVAEKMGVSGILAAVAAGIMQSLSVIAHEGSLLTRIRGNSVWNMLEYVFNGMVFILLGLQMPHIIGHLPNLAEVGAVGGVGVAVGLIAAIGVALMALRFIWVGLLAKFLAHRAARRREISPIAGRRGLAIITLAGVRGAVTLAGVLSIPLVLNDGTPFPARDLLIFLAAGVILFSIACAAVGLPLLMRGLPRQKNHWNVTEANDLQQQRADAAITAIEATRKARAKEETPAEAQRVFDEASLRVITLYRERMTTMDSDENAREHSRQVLLLENQLRLTALRAERTMLYRQHQRKKADETIIREQLRELDFTEVALMKQAERLAGE